MFIELIYQFNRKKKQGLLRGCLKLMNIGSLVFKSVSHLTLSLALIDLGCIRIRFSNLVSNRHGRFEDLSDDRRIRAIFG
jgi:hypothetical protein